MADNQPRRCCTSTPIIRVFMSHGCQAWDDQRQELCVQHLRSVVPVDGFEVVAEYDPDAVAWVWERGF